MLYIHIPFCDSKCNYCAFNSYTAMHEYKAAYMDAVLMQLEEDIKKYEIKEKSFESVFVGGGTPSAIPFKMYEKLFFIIHRYVKSDAEITFEANPNSASKEWLEGIKSLGANRVSFGVQSFDDEKLKFLGRAHTSSDAFDAVETAKNAGFEHISIDIIYSTPFDTKEFLERELNFIKELPIDHISLYSLTLEEGTKFAAAPYAMCERDEVYGYIINKTKKMGFSQYEVSNFAKHKSRHNIGYWQYRPYLGVGAGAVGCMLNKRTYPHKGIKKYIEDPLFKEYEKLEASDIKTEKILLGLRYEGGFDINLLNRKEKEKINLLEKESKISIKNGMIYNRNYFIADEIALFVLSQ